MFGSFSYCEKKKRKFLSVRFYLTFLLKKALNFNEKKESEWGRQYVMVGINRMTN